METWVLGVILALTGFLLLGCSLGHGEFGLYLPLSGVAIVVVGSVVVYTGFRKWLEKLQ